MNENTTAQRYVLSFARPIDDTSAVALGVELVVRTGSTIIVEVRDQSEFHGLIRRVESLGLKLVSVNPA